MSLIRLKNVSKAFGKLVVLNHLDLSIEAGQSLVVIGASGTGKSVLLKHIVGLLRPDAGDIAVFGADLRADPAAAKRQVAWLPDEPMLYDKLTPLEYLSFVAGLWRISPTEAAAEAERPPPPAAFSAASRPVPAAPTSSHRGGMRRRAP